MKHEWRKHEKELYIPKKNKPVILEVPPLNYLTIEGEGNPNEELFSKKIEALYSVSYGIRMLPKKGITPEGYEEYTVYPLEGFWSLTKAGQAEATLNKDELTYQIMIRQPEFVTAELAADIIEQTKHKKANPYLDELRFEKISEGLNIQQLHEGPYDTEPETIALMESFIKEEGYKRLSKNHKEIYLSGRNTPAEKLKTVLRFKVGKIVNKE
ncbi:GyrI-like domain-containing protein [Desemzia sp. RIT804]|uniref:GyrI-like domain-containing protein n=1 Tax=Desemzia sp. RIT 804 TaxID=2810209 RepID=UPI00194EB6CD|nr:GyrI-like domain-containing protein [Desemzia sp. RIT 804]MBM6614309.1 GyrI-like domain-containing protein [Desemzia sp. RIT 804]